MRLQKAVSSITWLARVKQDAQCTKNLSKKNSTDAFSYFAKEYSFLALTKHTGEIFFSNLATLIRVSSLGVKIMPPSRSLPWTYRRWTWDLGLGVLTKYAVSEKLPSG
jgi:hypothetical protein